MFRRKKQPQVPEPARIEILDLKPGDTVALTFPGRVSKEVYERIKAQVSKDFEGHRIMILEGGVSIKVVRDTEGATSND